MAVTDEALIGEVRAISGRLLGFAYDLTRVVQLLDLFMQHTVNPPPLPPPPDNDVGSDTTR